MTNQVEILLATYNGAQYIDEQIQSIQKQTVSDWRLSISDDCSTDGTLEILQRYAKQDSRITIVSSHVKYGSAQANFAALLGKATGSTIMFCDQDDIWHENKVELFINRMRQAEHKYGVDTPLMVFSDLVVVDSNDTVIAPSFIKLIGRNPQRTKLNELLVQNLVTGCACAMNGALTKLIRSLQIDGTRMLMHDWFYALIAAATGHVLYLDDATVDYRQHGTNMMGAHQYSAMRTLMGMVVHGKVNRAHRVAAMRSNIAQAQYLREILPAATPAVAQHILNDYCALESEPRQRRMHILCADKFWPNKVADRINQCMTVLAL